MRGRKEQRACEQWGVYVGGVWLFYYRKPVRGVGERSLSAAGGYR